MSGNAPLDVVKEYYEFVWTGKELDRISKLCNDPMIRHDPRGDVTLSLTQQRERITHSLPLGLKFQFLIAHGDDRFASVVWQASNESGDQQANGIQTLRVEDGKIMEVWNASRDRPW